jgi:hypothetical protein
MVTILKNETLTDFLKGFRALLGKQAYIDFLHVVNEYGVSGIDKQEGFKQVLDPNSTFDRFYDEINETLLEILDEGGTIEFEGNFKTFAVHTCIERIVPDLIDLHYKEETY